ncbi:MAG: DUF86 domain-containing protein [Deltaproteobacteria bacterium]|nr:DUF86 domain-containing protein [Deltaproteobacteria bacterium]MBW1993081.1 DUF86 domain-containing protein [Deltaproteobacteria bacterium]MBW2151187.1 DUF86 domain-containing protein [Deltaproteobacteria bacterium]
MVISNLNIKLIEDRLGFITKSLVKLKKLSGYDEDVFLAEDNPAIAESYLRRSLEAIFDIARHIIAKRAGKGIVEYKEIAAELGKIGVLTPELSERLRLMAGYRNRMVHLYHEVTDRELFTIIKNNLSDIENFVLQTKEFLKEYNKQKASLK